MYTPKTVYPRIALETINYFLQKGNTKKLQIPDVPEELFQIKRGCFVSLHLKGGALRGCIGTIEPREKNLFEEIKRNAVSAAIHDSRFESLSLDELPNIEISVDVLGEPTLVSSIDDLDPQIFGIIVSDGEYGKAVLLPSIPGIDTVEQQIDIVKRKAGLSKVDNGELEFYRFSSNRYH